MTAQPVELELHNEPLPLSAPFRIAGHVFEAMPATVVTLRAGAQVEQAQRRAVGAIVERIRLSQRANLLDAICLGTTDGIKLAVNATGGTCKSCHDDFRAK